MLKPKFNFVIKNGEKGWLYNSNLTIYSKYFVIKVCLIKFNLITDEKKIFFFGISVIFFSLLSLIKVYLTLFYLNQ